ncbi:MAG: tetratricopeptide repeat protein [Desulfobacter sp.]
MKHILRKAHEAIDEPRKQQVATNTKVVLFLATPHWGAGLALLADSFSKIFGTTVSIEELRSHDAYLEEVGNWYSKYSLRLGIQTATYYELKPFKGIVPIVNPTSSHPRVGTDPVGLDEDHLSIAKPNRKDAQICNATRDLIDCFVLSTSPATSSIGPSPPSRKNETSNREEQVDKLIDVTQQQTNLITQLISKEYVPYSETYHSPKTQEDGIGFVEVKEQSKISKYPVTEIPHQEDRGVSGDGIAMPQKRSPAVSIADLLQKLETVEDIEAEIIVQLSVWNSEKALLLSHRLENQLKGIDGTIYPRLLEYLLLIARVHIIYAENNHSKSSIHIDKAKDVLDQIEFQLTTSHSSAIASDVNALRGSIINYENGPDAALDFLSGFDDPYAIRLRLAMYLKKQDPDQAILQIEGRRPHLRWCDLAITAYVAAGRKDAALDLLKWVNKQKDRKKYPQCVVRLADASLAQALRKLEPGKNILPQSLSEAERLLVKEVLNDLNPVLAPIIEDGSVDSELSVAAMKIGWQAHHLLGNRDDVGIFTRIMSTQNPVPIDVARSVMSGYITPPPDLPKRLRNDHPNDLDANILATVVEAHMGHQTEAFEEAKKLFPLADTNEKKEELFKLFQEIWQELDDVTAIECERIARPLIDHNPQLQAMFDVMRALRTGNGDAALETLDKHKKEDDALWLQLRGNALMQKGNLGEAVDMFQGAGQQTGAPMLLHKTADLAFHAEKIAVAVECYEQLVKAEPGNLIARSNLASLYLFHLQDIDKAANQFRELKEAEPDNSAHAVNLAFCFTQLYRPKESLRLYEEACKVTSPDISAVLGQAELRVGIGDPDAACSILQEFKDRYWDSPDFLLACMNISYTAGDDDLAHSALCKLNELRAEGLVDENAFRMVHNDEVIEMFKESFKASEERKKKIYTEMLKGKLPWAWAAQLSSDAFYWAWRLRTQSVEWVGDDPINRTGYTVYSTNGFHAGELDDGRCTLLRLECPSSGTTVVADISALITLHRLGLLYKAADYFGEILIPQIYLATVLEDGRKMVIHQRSRQRTAEEISRCITAGTITKIDTKDAKKELLPVADEYQDLSIHRYHLIDVVTPIYQGGLIDEASFERVRKVCSKASSVDEEHPSLERLQKIHIELYSLETLSSFGLLSKVTSFYNVHIDGQAQIDLRQRLEAIRFQDETRIWHFDLWDQICANSRFRFVQSFVPQEMDNKNADKKDYLSFLSTFVAIDEGLPLLADDRSCQALALNKLKGQANAAFGSDAVILALASSSWLGISESAEAMHSLIKWRYRFVLPSPEILYFYAVEYRNNPPGAVLRDVAEYVHDCMRDTGLFSGPEKTDNQESMAMRFYMSWLNLISEWLILVWSGDDLSNETAEQLTDWCFKELLPSQPRVVHGSVKIRMASLTERLIISRMLLNTVANDDCISNALKAVQKAFGMTDDDYLQIVTEILNDTRKY